MNTIFFSVLCVIVITTEAIPQRPSSNIVPESLEVLGLSLKDSFDYNEFILNLEAVVEEFQQVALNAIGNTVNLAQQYARTLAINGTQENTKAISNIQSTYFKRLEDERQRAYEQSIDISNCVYPAIQQMHNESQTAIQEITCKLNNITKIFRNYTSVNYAEPAKDNLAKSYTIRERIYQCPFSFTDFTPFYACLTVAAVLDDVIILNQFAQDFNKTATDVHNLVDEFSEAVDLFRNENMGAFNAAAQTVYTDVFAPCAAQRGLNVLTL